MSKSERCNILLLSASRKVSLVRAFQGALRELGVAGCVIAGDSSVNSPALYLADRFVILPYGTGADYWHAVSAVIAENNIRLVVPTRDGELKAWAEKKKSFAERGTIVAVSNPDAVEVCRDKRAFCVACRSAGLGIPELYERDSSLVHRLPVFARPRRGSSSEGARMVVSQSQLDLLLAEAQTEYLFHEVMTGPEYTADVYSDPQGSVRSVVVRERQRTVAGESYVSTTRCVPGAYRTIAKLVGVLGLAFHSTVQFFMQKGKPCFVEVNPRYGGGAALGFAAGRPTPQYLISDTLGLKYVIEGEPLADLTMLRYTSDLFRPQDSLGA